MGADDGAASFNEMPGAPRQFYNRVPELDLIGATAAAARTAELPGLICVTGIGGMGKTTLVIQAAYRFRALYPDFQLFSDLRGSSAESPIDPFELLGDWLRQLGDSADQLPTSLTGRATQFRARTYRRRFLMILDDAFTAAQIRELLPAAPASLVIMTSRRWFDELGMLGFAEIKIGPFTSEVSAELLRDAIGASVFGAESAAVRDLVEVCAGTPLVLKVASARIGRWRRPQPVSAFVTALRSQQALAQLQLDGTPLVESIYDFCYAELTPDQAQAYRLLCLHPGADFGVEVAAAMLGANIDSAADVLYELGELELLDQVGPDRFRFHHLIGVHARQCASVDADEDQRRLALSAAVVYYLEFLVGRAKSMSQRPVEGTYFALIPATYTGPDAADLAAGDLEVEQHSLRAAVDAADSLGLDTECLELCEALRGWLYDTDRTTQLVDVMAIGVRVAQRSGDISWQLQMQRNLAVAYEKQGSALDSAGFKNGIDALRAARTIAQQLDKPLVVASTIEWEGLLHEARGQLDDALRELRAASAFLQQATLDPTQARRAVALLDMHIGRVLVNQGDRLSAVPSLRRALADFIDRGEGWVNVARLRHLVGAVALAEGNLDEAQELLDAAAAAFRGHRFGSQELVVHQLRADTAVRRGDAPAAAAALREALALAQRLGLGELEIELTRRIGEFGG